MTAQLESEKVALLERKRREQDEARRRQEELERILAENRRKVRAPRTMGVCMAGCLHGSRWMVRQLADSCLRMSLFATGGGSSTSGCTGAGAARHVKCQQPCAVL